MKPVLAAAQNPFESIPQQCDPYSSFGLFCNVSSLWEGVFVILAVGALLAASIWFVKKNEEENKRKET